MPPKARLLQSGAAPASIATQGHSAIPGPAPVPRELARASTLSAFARFSAFANRQRERLPAVIGAKLQRVPGAVLGLTTLALGALLVVGVAAGVLALYRAPKASTANAAAAGEVSTPPRPVLENGPAARATSAAPSVQREPEGSERGEAAILLDHAERLLVAGRGADVLPLIDRLIARQPALKNDARLARILLKSVASSEGQAMADGFAILKGPMGEAGAALVYELSVAADAKDAIRKRAEAWLRTKDFERVSSLQLYAAVKLRRAKTCEDKYALLTFVGNAGGAYVLDYLRELDRKSVCSPDALDDCFPCMRNDSELKQTIEKVQASLAP